MKPPKDLTMVAENNGGTFPFWRVFDIIAGDTPTARRQKGSRSLHLPDRHSEAISLLNLARTRDSANSFPLKPSRSNFAITIRLR